MNDPSVDELTDYYSDDTVTLHHGNALNVLATLNADTVKVEGQMVLRLKNGDEYPLGEVEWEVPVKLEYVP